MKKLLFITFIMGMMLTGCNLKDCSKPSTLTEKDLQGFSGTYDGAAEPGGGKSQIVVDANKREMEYSYFFVMGKPGTPASKMLDYYISEWTDIEYRHDSIRIYGKIHSATAGHPLIAPKIATQKDSVYGVFILKLVPSDNKSLMMSGWGNPDLSTPPAGTPPEVLSMIAPYCAPYVHHSDNLANLKKLHDEDITKKKGGVFEGQYKRK